MTAHQQRIVLVIAAAGLAWYVWRRSQQTGSFTTPLPPHALPPLGLPIFDAFGSHRR